jgi:hypothetical protein
MPMTVWSASDRISFTKSDSTAKLVNMIERYNSGTARQAIKAPEDHFELPEEEVRTVLNRIASPLTNKIVAVTEVALFTMLFVLPVCFGAVHPTVYLSAQLVVFLLLAAFASGAPRLLFETVKSNPLLRWVLLSLLLFLLYSLGQFLTQNLLSSPHPVLGEAGRHIAPENFWKSFNAVLFFTAVLIIVSLNLKHDKNFSSKLVKGLVFCGFMVSLIGLSHWFYDNGKLLWTFQPDYLFISTRARWPFVNSNHLAQYLLPFLFLLFARLIINLDSIAGQHTGGNSPGARFSRLITTQSFQSSLIRISFALVLTLSLAICITATLSRGSWLALSIGVALFLLTDKLILRSRRQVEAQEQENQAEGAREHSSEMEALDSEPEISGKQILKKQRYRKRIKRKRRAADHRSLHISFRTRHLTRPVILLFALGLFFFFLLGRGTDLVEDRIEYGLKYSKDDMRWTFYADTMQIIKNNPLWGSGLGSWSTLYPRHMNELLTDIKPAYLHSDPLQLVSESGIAGAVPFILIFSVTALFLFRNIRKASYRDGVLLLGLFFGLLSVIIASLTDFPFRIPAISFVFAVFLAYLIHIIDQLLKKND